MQGEQNPPVPPHQMVTKEVSPSHLAQRLWWKVSVRGKGPKNPVALSLPDRNSGKRAGGGRSRREQAGGSFLSHHSAVCRASNPLFQWIFTDPLPFFLSSRAGLRRFPSQIAAKPLHFPCPAEFSDSFLRNLWNLSDFGVCPSPLPASEAFRMVLPALCAVFGGLSGV